MTANQELASVYEFPHEVEEYIRLKVEKNGSGGRPHFVSVLAKTGNARDILLDILEAVWLKNKGVGAQARRYNTTYQTIWRVIQDLEPYKAQLCAYMEQVPRRKLFFNADADTSDYENVQLYIRRSKRDGVRKYRMIVRLAEKCWNFLKYRDPENWTAEDVHLFLNANKEGSQTAYLNAIRQIAPQIRDKNSQHYISTARFREKLRLRKKDLFSKEITALVNALEEMDMHYHSLVFRLHVTGGFREGKDDKAGLTGISWDRFKNDFKFVDDYETKVRGGIWWRDCPVDLFWSTLPEELRALWKSRGKPIDTKLVEGGYSELTKIYQEIRDMATTYFKDKVDPALFKEYTTLRPHDADKLHCNLLWEAEVPLETVAGQYQGRGEGIGLVGRGWLDINTIKKHYLSLTARSSRFQLIMAKIHEYNTRFERK